MRGKIEGQLELVLENNSNSQSSLSENNGVNKKEDLPGRVKANKKCYLFLFFQLIQGVEAEMAKEEEKQVMIEKAINLRLMCDYAVSCSYGDIVLIICMLYDYVKMLDEVMGDNVEYQAYYRKKFLDMAERLSGQIEYDYDKAVEKCRKKRLKETRGNDIGEDGLSQLIKRGLEKAENKKNKGKL